MIDTPYCFEFEVWCTFCCCHRCAVCNIVMNWTTLKRRRVAHFWLHSLPFRSVGCQRRGVNVHSSTFNTLRPRQDGRHFPDDTFKRIFMNENVRISINISLKFVSMSLINNIPALVQLMAWHRPGDKPLSEAMMVNSLTHICVTRPQWVNSTWDKTNQHNTILFLYVERRMVVVTNYTCTDNFSEFPCVWELRYVSKKYHRWILRILQSFRPSSNYPILCMLQTSQFTALTWIKYKTITS